MVPKFLLSSIPTLSSELADRLPRGLNSKPSRLHAGTNTPFCLRKALDGRGVALKFGTSGLERVGRGESDWRNGCSWYCVGSDARFVDFVRGRIVSGWGLGIVTCGSGTLRGTVYRISP